jgi:hypothetical protein
MMQEPAQLSLILATVAVAAVVYEWVAVKTDRAPTITEVIEKGGWPARIGAVVVASWAALDHFVLGWVL